VYIIREAFEPLGRATDQMEGLSSKEENSAGIKAISASWKEYMQMIGWA
jgi:hypothetical protein